jgi:hypothetical protein
MGEQPVIRNTAPIEFCKERRKPLRVFLVYGDTSMPLGRSAIKHGEILSGNIFT